MATGNKFIEDMPNAEYHASEGISKSGLDLIARSPAHYRYPPERKPTRAMEIGTAIHTAILEPDRFQEEYCIVHGAKDRRSKAYKEAAKVYRVECTLTDDEGQKIVGMQASIDSTPHIRSLVWNGPGRAELSAFAVDPETNATIRARFDWLTDDGVAVDLKKTQDVRPDQFIKSVFNYRYHVQAAFYNHVYKLITGQDLKAFAFLCVEEESPHSCAVYILDDEAMDLGERLFRRDLATYAACCESEEWPAPVREPQIISLPQWAINKTIEELEQ